VDLRELGEFGLIGALRRRAGAPASAWAAGIGDDAALLRPRAGWERALTVDALIEDVHFRWRTTDPRALGRKALRVNLSDLGAMGARPLGFLLALGLPSATPAARLRGFVDGLLAEARSAGCPLVGGDTVRAPCWSLAITALGEVPQGRALRRSALRAGERLFVTGELGASALGLHILESGGPRSAAERRFARRHQLPPARWRVGAALLAARLARAALDVSDGLAQDLGHLCAESGVGADVELDALPTAPGFAALCRRRRLDPAALAAGGGEDYELLFAVPSDAPGAALLSRRLGVRVREIGRARRGRGIRWFRGGRRVDAPRSSGFSPFKPR
jgi:thiamine-monophosphate kinase